MDVVRKMGSPNKSQKMQHQADPSLHFFCLAKIPDDFIQIISVIKHLGVLKDSPFHCKEAASNAQMLFMLIQSFAILSASIFTSLFLECGFGPNLSMLCRRACRTDDGLERFQRFETRLVKVKRRRTMMTGFVLRKQASPK